MMLELSCTRSAERGTCAKQYFSDRGCQASFYNYVPQVCGHYPASNIPLATQPPTPAWSPLAPKRSIPWGTKVTLHEAEWGCCAAAATAPGWDGINTSLLRRAWPVVRRAVRALYEGCLSLGHHPSSLKAAKVVPIPKTGRDPTSVKGWRPISLLPCLSKGLERIFARKVAYLTV